MLFDNATTFTKQGDIGEARAIYEYTRLGYTVSKPLADSAKYDLIIDDGICLKRVQVKTTACKNLTKRTKEHRGYNVHLATRGGNMKKVSIRRRHSNDYDILFVLTELNEAWSIPVEKLTTATTSIVVGNTKYGEFKI